MDRELIEHVAKALYCQHNNPLDHNLTREDLNRMAEAAIDAMQSYKHSGDRAYSFSEVDAKLDKLKVDTSGFRAKTIDDK